MRFTHQEFDELFDSYCSFLGLVSSALIHVGDCVADVSDMQPGLVVHVLDMLAARQGHAYYREHLDTFAQMASRFVTSDLLESLPTVRSVYRYVKLFSFSSLHIVILVFRLSIEQRSFATLLGML